MSVRSRSNPLALAVLSCLHEKPMHPYEVAQTLRFRAKHESIKLNYGSLYSVVESLEKRGLILARDAEREGRRPERTVYEITEAGTAELVDWLSEIVAKPEKEYLRFEAALTLIASLPPADALVLLKRRADNLGAVLHDGRAMLAQAAKEHTIVRLHHIEAEYIDVLLTAELNWLRGLITDIESGSLQGIDEWRSFHAPRRGGRQ